jgi:GAF domain-containing protein
VTELSERLNTILNVDDLLTELVELVKTRFGYYHAHVYLLDEVKENLMMIAGAGEAGQQMKAAGHSIPLNTPTSLVARVARNNEVLIVDNVQTQPDWLPNELLPETASEIAVPIVVDEQVVGVLDVQSAQTADFDEGDSTVLRSLANQVAVALRNAQIFAQTEAARATAEAVQARYLGEAWRSRQQAQQLAHYRRQDALELSQAEIEQLLQLAQEKEGVDIVPADKPAIVAPIRLQNQVIGAMEFLESDPQRQRTYTEQELAFVQAIADQVAQTAENLRLFDETRQRASREQTVREVTDRLRASVNMEQLLQTATEALGERFGASHVKLRLGIAPSVAAKNDNGQNSIT